MSLPSPEELQTRLHDFDRSKKLIPLDFIKTTLPVITNRYSSGVSTPVVLDELQHAWNARRHDDAENDCEDRGGDSDLPLVTGVIDDLVLARNGITYQAIVRDTKGGAFHWFVTKGYEKDLKRGMFVKMVAKLVPSVPRTARGLSLVLPTDIVALLISEKSKLGNEPVAQVIESMTLKRVWDERDQTPEFVSGKVIKEETLHGPQSIGDENSEQEHLLLRDVHGGDPAETPAIKWLLPPDLRDFRAVVRIGDVVILKEPVITPTGDSFNLTLSQTSRVYIANNESRKKPASPSNITKVRFESRSDGETLKRRRLA